MRTALLVLSLVLGGAACAPPPEEPVWLQEAGELAARGEPVEALGVLGEAAVTGHQPAAGLAAVRLLLQYQKVGWALQLARGLSEDHPGEPEAWLWRYRAALQNNLFEEAREGAERYLELAGPDAQALRHLGILEIHNRRPRRAAELLQRSLEELPGSPAGWYGLGRAWEMAGEDARAVTAYREAVARSGGPPVTWRLARLLARQGEKPGARRLLEELHRGSGLETSGLYLLGTLRLEAGERGSELLRAYRSRIRREELRRERRLRRQSLVEEVVILLRDGEPAAARRLIESLRSDHGDDERLAMLEAESWAAEGSFARAVEAAARGRRARPRGWRYRYLNALYLHQLGLVEEAVREVRAALPLQPLALETRLLELRLLEAAGAPAAAVERARRRVEILRSYALEREQDLTVPPRGEARTQLLFDLAQMHPLASRPEPESIPLD